MAQKSVIKLTKTWFSDGIIEEKPMLIGTESIISVEFVIVTNSTNKNTMQCSKIRSRGAMVETMYVAETIEEIWNIINNQ